MANLEDKIVLELDGKEVLIAENYNVQLSYMTQPNMFQIRLGSDESAADIIGRYPPKTPFKLWLDHQGQIFVLQRGYTDGYSAPGPPTTITLSGRDVVQDLHDAYVLNEKSFKSATVKELAVAAMSAAGYPTITFDYTNEYNRMKATGSKRNPQFAPPRSVLDEQLETLRGGKVKRKPVVKIGESWFQFLRRYLDRLGLFIHANVDGNLIISEPNTQQKPLYKITYSKDKSTTIRRTQYQNITSQRFAHYYAYYRTGSVDDQIVQNAFKYTDQEMVGWGYTKSWAMKDAQITNKKQAEFLARKECAKRRRDGWKLGYKVPGHTTDAIGGGTVTWAPDTIVRVQDDDLDIAEDFWIESVRFSRDPSTSVDLTLMRPADLIYGGDGS